MLTRSPTLRSAAVAAASFWPITDGTATSCGPLETVRTTVAPRRASAPAGGRWRTTRPFACLAKTSTDLARNPAACTRSNASATSSPTTLGTSTVFGRRATTITTVFPGSSSAPPMGIWRKTLPATAAFTARRISAGYPSERKRSTASSSLNPITTGTLFADEDSSSSRVRKYASPIPAPTSSSRSSSQGQSSGLRGTGGVWSTWVTLRLRQGTRYVFPLTVAANLPRPRDRAATRAISAGTSSSLRAASCWPAARPSARSSRR